MFKEYLPIYNYQSVTPIPIRARYSRNQTPDLANYNTNDVPNRSFIGALPARQKSIPPLRRNMTPNARSQEPVITETKKENYDGVCPNCMKWSLT